MTEVIDNFFVCACVCVWVWVYVNNRCDPIMCIDWRGTHLPSVFDLCSLVLVFLSEQWRNPWSSCRVAGVGVECMCMYKLWDVAAELQMCWVSLFIFVKFLILSSSAQSGMHYSHSHQNGPEFGSRWLYAVIRTRWDLLKPQLNHLFPGT